jgi:hypothetical protein
VTSHIGDSPLHVGRYDTVHLNTFNSLSDTAGYCINAPVGKPDMHLFCRGPLTNTNGSGLRWDAKNVLEKGPFQTPEIWRTFGESFSEYDARNEQSQSCSNPRYPLEILRFYKLSKKWTIPLILSEDTRDIHLLGGLSLLAELPALWLTMMADLTLSRFRIKHPKA